MANGHYLLLPPGPVRPPGLPLPLLLLPQRRTVEPSPRIRQQTRAGGRTGGRQCLSRHADPLPLPVVRRP